MGDRADTNVPVGQLAGIGLAWARILGAQLVVANGGTDSDLKAAFASFSQQRVGAVLVSNGVFYSRHVEQLAALAARHALPAIYPYREFALAGGLMSYGGSLGYFSRQLPSMSVAFSKATSRPALFLDMFGIFKSKCAFRP
jgi:putative ABC transport system substrate-binding protein